MKLKFKNLLNALLIAATAKVAANPIVGSIPNTALPPANNNDDNALVQKERKPLQKYVIKFRSDDSYLIAGHRSHSSHRSHRSHSSHRSSSGTYYSPSRSTTPSKSNSSSNNNSSSGSSSSNSSSSKNTSTDKKTSYSAENFQKDTLTMASPRICDLGDRTISLGLRGTDVKELATLLVKHDYLAVTDIETENQRYVICNAAMVMAIKNFQKDAGLKTDGFADAATIKALKKNQKDAETAKALHIYNLGDRTVSPGLSGTDVKLLSTLLVKHGYFAESNIETDSQGYTVCNAAMVMAIKKFQEDAGLEADGYAGAETIQALKNRKKDK